MGGGGVGLSKFGGCSKGFFFFHPIPGNHRVRLYTWHGQHLSVIGMHGRANGQFRLPLAVDVHPTGILLVGDADNDRIQARRGGGLRFGARRDFCEVTKRDQSFSFFAFM